MLSVLCLCGACSDKLLANLRNMPLTPVASNRAVRSRSRMRACVFVLRHSWNTVIGSQDSFTTKNCGRCFLNGAVIANDGTQTCAASLMSEKSVGQKLFATVQFAVACNGTQHSARPQADAGFVQSHAHSFFALRATCLCQRKIQLQRCICLHVVCSRREEICIHAKKKGAGKWTQNWARDKTFDLKGYQKTAPFLFNHWCHRGSKFAFHCVCVPGHTLPFFKDHP